MPASPSGVQMVDQVPDRIRMLATLVNGCKVRRHAPNCAPTFHLMIRKFSLQDGALILCVPIFVFDRTTRTASAPKSAW